MNEIILIGALVEIVGNHPSAGVRLFVRDHIQARNVTGTLTYVLSVKGSSEDVFIDVPAEQVRLVQSDQPATLYSTLTSDAQAEQLQRIIRTLGEVEELESKSHGIWDDSFSNLAFGNLSKDMREGYIKQTYLATAQHGKAMDLLRRLEFWLKYGEELN
jgi:hypothetical protein